MERTIRLLDGEHVLRTPTYYGLQLIDDLGGNDGSVMGSLPAVLAALLTDAEELDAAGNPMKMWHPVAVAKLIPMDKPIDDIWADVSVLIEDSIPKAPKGKAAKGETDPTPPPGGTSA